MAADKDHGFPVVGDDRFAFTLVDGAEDVSSRFLRGHDEELRGRVFLFGMKFGLVVGHAKIAFDEAGVDAREGDARSGEFRRRGFAPAA